MSTAQVAPVVPPRPARAQQAAAAHGVTKLPDIPPRPLHKRLDRSVSPGNYPRSPLNEPWSANLTHQKTNEQATEALPRRPSVQNLPSLGQEGMEYADILDIQSNQQAPATGLDTDAAAQTRNIAHDLHLHAPKPSLPKASATAQVQAVTRTDSVQAVAHGLGKPSTPLHDEGEQLRQVRTRSSFSRPTSAAAGDRRSSVFGDEETGPAELGIRVPINPLLGDVQAPSPAPGLSPAHTGTNGDKKRSSHLRAKASRDVFTPPGSYGLHGHGVAPQDRFEKDWYAKHPEAAQIEETHGHGVYESIGSGRGAFAMSSDDLNKIVRDTASRGLGSGTTPTAPSYPDEQIGYLASDLYTTRSQQGTPNSLAKTVTNSSQPPLESPLRKSSFPADDGIAAEVRRSRLSIPGKHDEHEAVEIEQEGEVQIPPPRRYHKITGGEESMNETLDYQASAPHSNLGEDHFAEHGYSVPILAADEVAKDFGNEDLRPAVSPKYERRGSLEPDSGAVTPGSRPPSRPTSMYSLHSANHSLSRFISHHEEQERMHTPLEDVDEYEPLFPEDDESKPVNHAERFKPRPNALRQRFPSQDIWEDTPSSALYSATVSTPDLPAKVEEASTSKTFEPPEAESARQEEASEKERTKVTPKDERLAKSLFAPHLRDDMPTRPGMVPRFPSQDIWEDSPESHHLVTTIIPRAPEPQEEETSPVDTKPIVPQRPAKMGPGEIASSGPSAPSVPPRPQKAIHAVPPLSAPLTDTSKPKDLSPTLKKVPSIPDRPKPQIPSRPTKKPAGEDLAKTLSGESIKSTDQEKVLPPITKAKPQIPARPVAGSKIANLRGNFMNDLNQKLGLGPPKEKDPEPEAAVEEAKPLEDARKSRARGPQRRAPAKGSATPVKSLGFAMFAPRSLWTIDEGELNLASTDREAVSQIDAAASSHLSGTKAAPMANSAAADSTLAPTIDTTGHADLDEKKTDAEQIEAPAAAEDRLDIEDPEPSLGTPTLEKSNPLSVAPTRDESSSDVAGAIAGESRGLSQHTTASSGQVLGPELEREEADPSTDAIPMSMQTTASSKGETAPLERKPSVEEKRVLPKMVPQGELETESAE